MTHPEIYSENPAKRAGEASHSHQASASRPMMRAPDSVLSAASGRWLTLSLFAMETVGTVIYYWQGLPLYRLVAADPNVYRTPDETRAWSLLAIALIQVGYWVRYRIGPPQPQVVSTALGHIVLFLSRMVFTLATAVFSFVFISRKLAFEMPVLRYVLMLAGLFSLFLYMKDLQRLGNALIRRQNKPDESVGSEPVSARVA